MNKYQVIFYGTPAFSTPTLQTLIDSPEFNVIAVVTQPDRPAGRGRKLTPSPVKQIAEKYNIKVLQPENIKNTKEEFLDELNALGEIDVAIVIAFGQIIPLEVLNHPKKNSLNLHASLLPRWRGAAPIQRAIEAGDEETGVCLMGMEAGLDTGPVYAKASIAINGQTAGKLHDQLSKLSAELIKQNLISYLNNQLIPEAQPASGICYAKKITKSEERLDWSLSAKELSNKIKAFSPFPGLNTIINKRKIKIIDAEPENIENCNGCQPGEVILVDKNSLIVASKSGAISLKVVKPEGKQQMPVNSFLAGFKINVGDVFE